MSTLDPQLKIIRVYGTLAKVLKRRTFKAAVHSPKDAIAFLLANFPEVQQYLRPRFFRINIGNRCINEQELDSPTGLIEEIHIIPSVSGAGGPAVNIIAGVSLIVASVFVPFLAPILLPLGIGLTLVGIGQLLSPTPGVPDEESNPRNSFNFSGIQQTSREGPPVPLVYGDIVTGSIVISAGFDEFDEEIEFDFIEGQEDPNPEGPGQFPQVYSTDYCAEHYYRYTIEVCLSSSWLSNACDSVSVNACSELVLGGKTLPTVEYYPEGGVSWRAVGDCDCGTFYEFQGGYPGIVFTTGPGVCNDAIDTASQDYFPTSAVCGSPPDWTGQISYTIVKTEIYDPQTATYYEVNINGFPHAGFLDSL